MVSPLYTLYGNNWNMNNNWSNLVVEWLIIDKIQQLISFSCSSVPVWVFLIFWLWESPNHLKLLSVSFFIFCAPRTSQVSFFPPRRKTSGQLWHTMMSDDVKFQTDKQEVEYSAEAWANVCQNAKSEADTQVAENLLKLLSGNMQLIDEHIARQ